MTTALTYQVPLAFFSISACVTFARSFHPLPCINTYKRPQCTMACPKQALSCLCSCEWTRRKTKSDEANWLYLPTIYPADALVTLKAAA